MSGHPRQRRVSSIRRSEKHFYQHLNKASLDYGAQVVIGTPEKNEISKFTLEACSKWLSFFQRNLTKNT